MINIAADRRILTDKQFLSMSNESMERHKIWSLTVRTDEWTLGWALKTWMSSVSHLDVTVIQAGT
jgi:hypothetical protein